MRAFWIVLTTLLVVASAGAFFWWPRADASPAIAAKQQGNAGGGTEPATQPKPQPVVVGKSYYVLLSMVEASPRTAKGSRWDADGSAPDLIYTVDWQGQQVFKSSKKADTLLAKWSNVSVDWKNLVRAVSLDDSIKAARITVRDGQSVTFKVLDADIMRDDLVAEWEVPVTQLKIGDQVFQSPGNPGGRLVQAHCRVLPLDRVEFETLVR